MGTVKRMVQSALGRVGIHERLKASVVYDVYWTFAQKSRIDEKKKEIAFYQSLLGFSDNALIFDIGANDGTKTAIFLKLGARVVAVEPDEHNIEIIKGKFQKYRLAKVPVTIVDKAVSDKAAFETMWIDGPGSALNTFNKKWVEVLQSNEKQFARSSDQAKFSQQKTIETTTLDHLMKTYGKPLYVKIDVEGYERNVLAGLSHRVPFLSFEVNLPEFRSEGLECVDLLHRLDGAGVFNYTGASSEGLMSSSWLAPAELATMLKNCSEESVEVFWKTAEPRT
jgi:FkbM family methyltransferase